MVAVPDLDFVQNYQPDQATRGRTPVITSGISSDQYYKDQNFEEIRLDQNYGTSTPDQNYKDISLDQNYVATRPDQYYEGIRPDQFYYQTNFVSSPILTQPSYKQYPTSPASSLIFRQPTDRSVQRLQDGQYKYNYGGSKLWDNLYFQPVQAHHTARGDQPKYYCGHYLGHLRPCYN